MARAQTGFEVLSGNVTTLGATVSVPGTNVDPDYSRPLIIALIDPWTTLLRDQKFPTAISGVVSSGATITGFGIGLESTTGGSVSFTNGSSVVSAVNGVDLTSNGGALSYSGSGSVTATSSGIVTSSGSGDTIVATGNGAITGAGGPAIDSTASGGTINITTAGSITGSSAGIKATNSGLGLGKIFVNVDAGKVWGKTGSGIITSATDGKTTINTNAATILGDLGRGIDAKATGVGAISITTGGTVTGSLGGIRAKAVTVGSIDVNVTGGNVLGVAGNGIETDVEAGTSTVTLSNTGTNVQGLGLGSNGIKVNSGIGGTSNVIVGVGTSVSGAGSGILATAGGSGVTNITNDGTVTGAGSAAAPVISIGNDSGTVTITNNSSGLIANNATATLASNNAMAIGTTTPAATGANNINNAGVLIGAISLAAGANTFTNQGGGQWVVSDNTGNFNAASFGTGATNTLNNNLNGTIFTGTVAAGSVATFTGLATVSNAGTFYAGNSTTSVTNINPNAGTAQIVTNTGTINVNGTLNFANLGTHNAGSTFTNGSNSPVVGIIDMSRFPAATAPDGTVFPASTHAVTDLVTLGTTSTSGTSDKNYTYAFGPAYNYVGSNGPTGNNSVLNVDSLIYKPGSSSDRLAISGTAIGQTRVNIWDTNANPAAYNPTGITIVAVNGQSQNAFVINGQTNPAHQVPGSYAYDLYEPNVGPMGAIKKQFFFYPLLQDKSANSRQGIAGIGSRYALFSLPDAESFQLPIAITAAQSIFNETAGTWEERRGDLRQWIRRSGFRTSYAAGGGSDMPLKAGSSATLDDPGPGPAAWLKVVGSWTDRHASQDLTPLLAAAGVLGPFDLGYTQATYGVIGGLDGGKEEVLDPSDAVVVGIMGGAIQSNLNFKASPTSFRFTGGTAGLSASYMSHGWYADVLVKADYLETALEFPSLVPFGVPTQRPKAINAGALANIGFRVDNGPAFLEPLVSVSYVRTMMDSFTVPGMTANFGNGESFRVGGGARTGLIWVNTAKYEVDSSVTARVWNEFIAKESVTLATAGPDVTLSDQFTKAFADISSQLNVTNKGEGWSAYMNLGAKSKLNRELVTVSGKGGMRYQF